MNGENDMGVYIDRDELLELYANTDELDISNYDIKVAVIRQNILDMPTIDLVRCGECKWWESAKNGWNGWCRKQIDAYATFYAEDFCSYGERKSDEN